MNKVCPECGSGGFLDDGKCKRCAADPQEAKEKEKPQKRVRSWQAKLARRVLVCLAACLFTIFGFYVSLIVSAQPLADDERQKIYQAITVLDEKGFAREAFLLRYLTAYRATDNWLNASTREENAYAATNFPFEIMTVYPDFFQFSRDETDMAAILLHEAQHLQGKDEPEAYEYVWRSRHRLGWTYKTHGSSKVWINTQRQTQEVAPHLFTCREKPYSDCTEE
jgi:hypothetical protein